MTLDGGGMLTEHAPRRPKRAIFLALGLGAVLIAGGAQRVSGPSYTVVHDLGGANGWGATFMILGIAMIVGSQWRPRLLPWAYRVAAVAYVLFALACLGAAVREPNAGLTGIVTYSAIAWMHVSAATAESHTHRAARRFPPHFWSRP